MPGKLINKVEDKWKIQVPKLNSIISRNEWYIRKKNWIKDYKYNSDESNESLKSEQQNKLNELFKRNMKSKSESDDNIVDDIQLMEDEKATDQPQTSSG
uniref:MADF domain-containing protein n=1 Tax=Meloidogyne hapla TaxID=6305 RepID=A0A1I8B734_MELHA